MIKLVKVMSTLLASQKGSHRWHIDARRLLLIDSMTKSKMDAVNESYSSQRCRCLKVWVTGYDSFHSNTRKIYGLKNTKNAENYTIKR